MNINQPKFKEGDWVRFHANGKKTYVGYIENYIDNQNIIVFIPSQMKRISVKSISLLNNESPRFTIEDIHSMQHIAINSNDREWFDELAEFKGMLENITPPL